MIGGGRGAKALSLSGNPVEESITVCKHLAVRGLIDASTFWKTLLKSYIISILLTTGLIVRVRASAAS